MSQQPIPSPTPALDLDNIQGDILSGLPKKTQTYLVFQITDAQRFRKQLNQFIPLVKTVSQVLKDRKAIEDHKKSGKDTLLTLVGVNFALSHTGFVKLGIDDSNLTTDNNFKIGQKADAFNLKDKGTGTDPTSFVPDWDPAFLGEVHGVFLVSGESHPTVDNKVKQIKQIFGVGTPQVSIKEIKSVVGDVRPGKLHAHEHFGFLDNISEPAVIGFDKNPLPGPKPVDAGHFLLGRTGDPQSATRPAWVVDGSYFVFRVLSQNVLEFHKYLKENPIVSPGLTAEEGSELLGARLVGRWKSGTPIDLAPFKDDPEIAKDPKRINNFQYAGEATFQKICPFAAHTRKTNPRDDLTAKGVNIDNRRIIRRGIQFGPEVTREEKIANKTIKDRGLVFACYQTSITDAFAFIQESWANNPKFPPSGTPEKPGLDPLIGQGPQGSRTMTGTDIDDPKAPISFPDFVIPKGGEYFFSPSIKGLKEKLATP